MMDQNVVLISGTSRGLGKVLAEELVKRNYHVYSGVREIDHAPKGTTPLLLDVTKEEQIEEGVKRVIAESGKIDFLIHNAAIAYYGAAESMTLDQVKDLFTVNLFGAFRLTQQALPFMRSRRSGKILFVSSIRAIESCAYMGMYSASKAALEAYAFDLAATLVKWNISVSVIQPGPMDTGIELKEGSHFKDPKNNPYLPYGHVELIVQSTREVGTKIAELLTAPSAPFRVQTNSFSKECVAKHLKDPTGMKWLEEQQAWIKEGF